MSLQLLIIMALVGMCMLMPLNTGNIAQPCEKQGDPVKIETCKFLLMMKLCAMVPAKAWCCVPSERHYFMWLKEIKLKTLLNSNCEFGNTMISMLYTQMSKYTYTSSKNINSFFSGRYKKTISVFSLSFIITIQAILAKAYPCGSAAFVLFIFLLIHLCKYIWK